MPPHDWSHLQSFAAVAEHGSLSAAARALGSSQPTISRHIQTLEQSLGARLFERDTSGVVLTEKGAVLQTEAARMAEAAARLALLGTDAGDALSGTVRITASQIVATYLLPDILTALHQEHPGIAIELLASDDTNNLLRREADIAVRMYRPTQDDVITRHIGNLDIGAYAAQSYVDRHGLPLKLEDLMEHDLVGYDRSTLIIDAMHGLGFPATRDLFKFRSDDQVVCWQMVCAGFGIGFNQRAIAERTPGLVSVADELPVGRLPVWLTSHAALRESPRIRKVYDGLAKGLSGLLTPP